MDDDGLTLDQAAIFAEFEGDNQATDKLTRDCRGTGHSSTSRSSCATPPPKSPH
jgi:hypothetical protein